MGGAANSGLSSYSWWLKVGFKGDGCMAQGVLATEHYQRLIRVAQEITAQRDISKLCETVLEEAGSVTGADGGTVYLGEGQGRQARLEFAIVRNHRLGIVLGGSRGGALDYPPVPLYQAAEPNHANVASHAGLTAKLVNIHDVYHEPGFDFSGTRAFDERFGYRTRSVLTVPLLTDVGELGAVRQLLNAGAGHFDEGLEAVVEMLASFAGIAIQQQRTMQDQKELLVALSGEPNTGRLLERILMEAQGITHADGGTLYLFRDDNDSPRLEFALLRNNSLQINQGGASGQPISLPPIPLSDPAGNENHHHIAAHAALTGRVINIADAYQSDEFDFSGTRAFDAANGYRSISFLTIPLLNHLNEVIGVLQLVNAQHPQSGERVPFSEKVEPLVRALGSYAAIALNNLILVQELKNLLDAFIKVIAQAIDAKSSHTSGHCQRVPLLTELLVRAAAEDQQAFSDFSLDEDGWYELHVASWLHDCGKLATPDSVLDKSTKLQTLSDRIEIVKARFAALKAQRELQALGAMAENPEQENSLRLQMATELAALDEALAFVVQANKGGEFMSEEHKARIRDVAALRWRDASGTEQPLLTEDEVYNLCIERGTLTPEERQIINNHMQVTIDMLESLPFPRKLRRVPEYAGGHHEKMDGSGFPRGLTREQMSIPARAMAIADIFEALTAKDRPYKEPMKISQALSIMKNMKQGNHIDPDLYDLFVKAEVWKSYAEKVLAPEQLDIKDATPYY